MGERAPVKESSAGPLTTEEGVIHHTLEVGVTRTREFQTRATDQQGRTTTEASDQRVHPVTDWCGTVKRTRRITRALVRTSSR